MISLLLVRPYPQHSELKSISVINLMKKYRLTRGIGMLFYIQSAVNIVFIVNLADIIETEAK